jgi:hypothetical protein
VGPLENQGFMKVKLHKPFFLAKNLQKQNEKKCSRMKKVEVSKFLTKKLFGDYDFELIELWHIKNCVC